MAGAEAIAIGLVGAVIALLGSGVASGRLWLLANYDPDAVESEPRVARLSGGAIVAFGLLTVGFAWGLRTGLADHWWWVGWTSGALVVAVVVASLGSGRL